MSVKFSEQVKAGSVSGTALGIKGIIVDKKDNVFGTSLVVQVVRILCFHHQAHRFSLWLES